MKQHFLTFGVAILGASLLAAPAMADWHHDGGNGPQRGYYDGYHHWHFYPGYAVGGYYPPPPPVYYAPPPPVYYAPPPPVYYAPPPSVVITPGGIGFVP